MKWELGQLLFADDTAIVADSHDKLQRMLDSFGSVCGRRKLVVNVSKSRVVVYTRGLSVQQQFTFGQDVLDEVDSFKYLESEISKDD